MSDTINITALMKMYLMLPRPGRCYYHQCCKKIPISKVHWPGITACWGVQLTVKYDYARKKTVFYRYRNTFEDVCKNVHYHSADLRRLAVGAEDKGRAPAGVL
jgi:hypothetical protein